MPYSASTTRAVCAALLLLVLSAPAGAQDKPTPGFDPSEAAIVPVYVTARVFQMRAVKGGDKEISDQVFRQRTAALGDEDKWRSGFNKVYPGFETDLLHTRTLRVFRTAKPATLVVGKEGDRSLEIQLNAANSPGESDDKPGTSFIADVGLHFGNAMTRPPITFAIQPIEVAAGMTYFFAVSRLRFNGGDYAQFLRKGTPVAAFADYEVFLVFAFSIEMTKPTPNPRQLDEAKSAALQTEAKKKVQPELPAALRAAGLTGRVQIAVEIAPDGKVVKALTQTSSLPEMNRDVLAAVRQWEFPLTLFNDSKQPLSAVLSFDFTAK